MRRSSSSSLRLDRRKGVRAVLLSAVAARLLAPAPARATGGGAPDDRDHVAPCRPTIACTADLSSPGTLELETGYLYRALPASATQRSFPVLLKLTLATWLQVQLGGNGYTVVQGEAPAHFFDNVVVGLKLHLADQTAVRPSLALTAAASLPTLAGQEGYVRAYDALLTAHASKDLGPIHGDLNVGTNLWRLEDHPLLQAFGALALSTALVAPFAVTAEGYVFSDAAPVATRDGGFLFAVSHAPRTWLTFDLGGDIGFFPATRAYSVFVGVSVVPAVLWR
jgi:hypothetical protein